jgi:hypothetical protein
MDVKRSTLLFALISACTVASQSPPDNVSVFGKRYDAFREMFGARKLAIGSLQAFEQIPSDQATEWIVVAVGDVSSLPRPIGGWRRFVRSGGSLLIATDHGDAPTDDFRVKFQPRSVFAAPGVECYPDFKDCPLVHDLTEDSPLFENIELLALNRSGYLDVSRRPEAMTVARLPAGTTDSQGRPVGGKSVVYGAAEEAGRFLFAADHSLFINETMLNHNNEVLNAPFANNTVDWLIAGRDPKNLKVLFLEDGRPISEWIDDPRYYSGNWPSSTLEEKLQSLDKLLRAVDEMILKQQSRRDPNTGLTLYNQAVRDWESRQRPLAFLQAALWGLAAFLMMTTAAWLLGRRNRISERATAVQHGDRPTPPPPYGPKPEDDPAQRSLLDRRRIEMLEEGHYVDLARRLSRVWLTQQLGEVPSGPVVEPPPLRTASSRLRGCWKAAWMLATDGDHPAVTLSQFQRFRTDLASIQQLLDRWRRSPEASRTFMLKENA